MAVRVFVAGGVSHVVAQGFGAFNGIREDDWVKTEEELG
jgi:hypothetical protein